MFVLTTTSQSVTAVMSGAAATTNPDFTVCWLQTTTTTSAPGSNNGAFNGTTPVTLVSAPGSSTQRSIRTLTINNRDTAAVTITLRYVDGANTRNIHTVTLAAGDSFYLSTEGISTLDANGNIKTTAAISDSNLSGISSLSSTGLVARTGSGTFETRTLTAPAAGISVSNGDGVSGNPTLALANDLAAVEGLSSTGLACRTGSDTWEVRTLTAPAAGITVSNGTGASGNPTLALANDLSALEGLSGTGLAVRTGSDAWINRTITAGSGISVTNGDGVSGNPTIAITSASINDTNILINGGFDIWQRQTPNESSDTSYNDDTYLADRWYALTQTSNLNASRQTGNVGPYAIRLTQPQVSAQRIGIAQAVEADISEAYRSRVLRFQFNVKASTTTTVRYALLEWTGTRNSPTSDVVLSWTSGTYTAGNFFLASNLTVVATGSTSVGTSFTSCSVSGTISASCTNLIVMVWSESTMAQSATLTVSEAGLYETDVARDWVPRHEALEEILCRRYAQGYETLPIGLALNSSALYGGGAIRFAPPMRATPTLRSGSSFTATVGSAGSPGLYAAARTGASLENVSSNWTANANITFTGILEAEL